MPDIPATDSAKIARFAKFQMATNPAGIGNECTHVVYAALFEVRAMDGVLQSSRGQRNHPDVQSARAPYTWGRPIAPTDMLAGDIAQFTGHVQNEFVYSQPSAQTQPWASSSKTRAPNHTGIIETRAEDIPGMFLQYEAHLTDPNIPRMQVRIGRVYYESFAINIPLVVLNSSNPNWMPGLLQIASSTTGAVSLLHTVFWGSLRRDFGITATNGVALETAARRNSAPRDLGILFNVRVVPNSVVVFRPQMSNARRTMTPAALDAEKQRLIQAMQRSGRVGHNPGEDQFGGDNRAQRIRDGRFDWTFRDQP